MPLRTETDQLIELNGELGRGGEGVVYDVRGRPDQVAKIWHAARADTDDARTTARKIRHMVQQKPNLQIDADGPNPQQRPCVVWPDAVIFDENRRTVGFLMPKVGSDRFHSSFRYFNPASRRELETQRRQPFMARDPFIMARNLALAVGKLHQAGYVVGDINEQNILVNNLMEVAIVDADSMQVTDAKSGETLRCTKGREDYTSPRLQGLRFREHDRSPNDDLFGMAVLIFKITMQGVHPYASTSNPDDENAVTSLGQKIKLQYFPYNESGHTPPEHQPSQAYRDAWQSIPFDLRHLFRLAFDPDSVQTQRPSPELWARVLNRIIVAMPTGERWETPPPAATAKPASRRRRNDEWRRPAPPASPTPPARPRQSAPGLSASAASARYNSQQRAVLAAGRQASWTPQISLQRAMVGILAMCISLMVTVQILTLLVYAIADVHIGSAPHCLVWVDDRQVKASRVAPDHPDHPGDAGRLNWERDGIALVEGADGGCTTELPPLRTETYVSHRGHEVDMFGVMDGVPVTEWVDVPADSAATSSATQLIATLMSALPLMCILIIYSISLLVIRGTAVAPPVDIAMFLGMALGLFGMRFFGMLELFTLFDDGRLDVYAYGIGVVGTIIGNFWTTISAFAVTTIAMQIFRSYSSTYTYNRP